MAPKAVSRSAPKRRTTKALDRIGESLDRGELVAVIGTGVSMSLTNGNMPELSWRGLIENGFNYAVKKGRVTDGQAARWRPQLESTDLDELLGAAEFVGRKLDAPRGDMYGRWLEHVFKRVRPTNRDMSKAIEALSERGVPLCTLNYDSLIEHVTGRSAITMADLPKVTDWFRRTNNGVLHLHGCWDTPSTCILGIRDYETTINNDVRDFFQRNLGSFRLLLFIGCGDTFADPNLSALIAWLRSRMKTAAPEHLALVREAEVAARHADASWQGFVEPLAYGEAHDDLAAFLVKRFKSPRKRPASAGSTAKARGTTTTTQRHASLVNAYRAFLLRDCGQMTIEGVRADMDTAQRKFDLERLFVPLQVVQPPPTIPNHDPKREEKLQKWLAKNKTPRPFGAILRSNRRIALLALPGGGKTLLLKRLAVAYADVARRNASTDRLPDWDLTPVLIRCREWREHLHRPIPNLLRRIPEITGQPELEGLGDALLGLFKKGKALLLVDGLDEIHDDATRSTFVDHLEAFLSQDEVTRLVVTSREAGFSLVAPSLARFCQAWRVAPLDEAAIVKLSEHWHQLMGGDSPEVMKEARDVAQQMIGSDALRRLAENPLLLTMLLVVKHGAGRLPPDRVTLYDRAIEVLLDTWNIKGHAPLKTKEAVPQLAYVAFEMMRSGKQTATERELLDLIEAARENVPQIRRYAKDSPHEFLNRVELRSSLVVEAGHQTDGATTVPFYQFRHLTFQEHLAAVAAVEGHYAGYASTHTPLTPLSPYLTAEEWKEVVPMSAVLARKQAEPLIAELVHQGEELRSLAQTGDLFPGKVEWLQYQSKLPAPIARLAQCLVEEAEAEPDTLHAALRLLVFFARGCRGAADWRALSSGPYGDELRHQALTLFRSMQWPESTWMLNTCGALFARWDRFEFWWSREGHVHLAGLLESNSEDDVIHGLLVCLGLLWNQDPFVRLERRFLDDPALWTSVERHLLDEERAIWMPAAWVWAFVSARSTPSGTPAVLDRLLAHWLAGGTRRRRVDFALFTQLGLMRAVWRPVLTPAQVQETRRIADEPADADGHALAVSLFIGFHAQNVWPDDELTARLERMSELSTYRNRLLGNGPMTDRVRDMLTQLREVARHGAKRESRRQNRVGRRP